MAYQIETYTFEIEETFVVAEIERFVASLSEIKKDDTLKLEERKLLIITTTRADVATVLEPIFKQAEVKKVWKKYPENGNKSKKKDIAQPAGFAPFQEAQ